MTSFDTFYSQGLGLGFSKISPSASISYRQAITVKYPLVLNDYPYGKQFFG